MNNLSKKLFHYYQTRGMAATVKKAMAVGLKNLVARRKSLRERLQEQVNRHNKSYGEISRLVLEIHHGVHPKHRILNYHQYFLDHIVPQDIILDIGCGNGYLAFDLASKAQKVIGIDIDPKNIISAQTSYQKNNLQFLIGNATTGVYEKGVSKIILSNVLEHIEHRQPFLESLHSIAPVILLRVPLVTRDWLAFYKRAGGFEYRLDSTHFTEYTQEELKNELELAGWKIESGQINWGEWWGVVEKI